MAPRRSAGPNAPAARVVFYVRVSSLMGRSGEDFHSPGVQIDAMHRAATLAGLREIATVDDDIDVSGRGFTRKGLDRIRDMVAAGQVDVVAVHELSRLGRNLSEALDFIKWLRKHNVSVMSTQEKIDETPEGQFMLGTWLNLAELFGNQMSRKWATILERRARLGRAHGKTPQGYLRDDGIYIADPVLGPAITAMFAAYARGEQISAIADAFTVARGKPVDRTVVKRMLQNPIYAGRVVLNSSTAGHLDLPGAHPALVDEQTWQRVQRRVAADRGTPPRHLAPSYALTGLGECALCNRKLQVWVDGNRRPAKRLHCPHRAKSRDCPGIGTPLYAEVEEAVLAEVRQRGAQLKGNPAERAAARARTQRAAVDVRILERELVKTRDAVTRLTEGWARGDVPDDAYQKTVQRLRAAEEAQGRQLASVQDVAEALDPGETVVLIERVLALWPDLSGQERNQGLRAVLLGFTVRRAARWREPESERVGGFRFRGDPTPPPD